MSSEWDCGPAHGFDLIHSKNSERVGYNCAENNPKLLIINELAERVGFESVTLLETTELSGAVWSSKVLQGNERNC